MSFCTSPTEAAKIAVNAPTMQTVCKAAGASSNIGDRRATMNTPAVTMVAAWIRADTGVGPSIASGSQVCNPSCADLPMAPTNSSRQRIVSAWPSNQRKLIWSPTWSGAAANTVSKCTDPNIMNTPKMPSAKPKSPTRLTTNAFMDAAFALSRSYQKPMSR
jgi:hypothetical protein